MSTDVSLVATHIVQCKSWFKRGTSSGRVVALYPGSANAFRKMLMNPRWEDFHFKRSEITGKNPFGYLGIAMTLGETDKSAPTPYLDSIDIPPIPAMI